MIEHIWAAINILNDPKYLASDKSEEAQALHRHAQHIFAKIASAEVSRMVTAPFFDYHQDGAKEKEIRRFDPLVDPVLGSSECAVCAAKKGDEYGVISSCGGCSKVYYCSRECQKW